MAVHQAATLLRYAAFAIIPWQSCSYWLWTPGDRPEQTSGYHLVEFMVEGESMARVQHAVIVQIVLLLAGLSPAGADSGFDAKAARHFTPRWSGITYNKVVQVHNPAVSSTRMEASESLSLSCEIVIRDPNLVLGTSREGVITQLTASKGREIALSPAPSRSRPGQNYEGLQYQERYTQPPAVPRWRAWLRSTLRLPQDTTFRPQLVTELRPSPMGLSLDMAVLQQAGGELRSVKGHFHALLAESIENIDVPFEPNDTWVRLTPDLEIQVREASSTGSSFRFNIETRPQGGSYGRPLSVGDPLPGRLVVGRQLLGADGKPTGHFGGFWRLPVPVGGMGGGGGRNTQIKTIRFLVAIRPTDCRIPFEFQRVPLPDPNQPPARHQPSK